MQNSTKKTKLRDRWPVAARLTPAGVEVTVHPSIVAVTLESMRSPGATHANDSGGFRATPPPLEVLFRCLQRLEEIDRLMPYAVKAMQRATEAGDQGGMFRWALATQAMHDEQKRVRERLGMSWPGVHVLESAKRLQVELDGKADATEGGDDAKTEA